MCVYVRMYVCVRNCNCLCSVGVISTFHKSRIRARTDWMWISFHMRCALSVTQPRIRQLTEKKQDQPSQYQPDV